MVPEIGSKSFGTFEKPTLGHKFEISEARVNGCTLKAFLRLRKHLTYFLDECTLQLSRLRAGQP